MLFTKDKPLDEVLESLGEEKNIFLLACNGCAEACETGGEKALSAMKTARPRARIRESPKRSLPGSGSMTKVTSSKEVAKLRKDRDDLVETLQNVQKKLELVEERNRELMATLLESLHQQLKNAMNERRRQEVVHDKRLEDIQEQVSAIQEQVASDNNHNRRGHIDAINVKLQKDNN